MNSMNSRHERVKPINNYIDNYIKNYRTLHKSYSTGNLECPVRVALLMPNTTVLMYSINTVLHS